jgi:uncharacterized protein
LRVLLDNNIYISALWTPGGNADRVVTAAREGRITNVTSEPLLAELADVASRRKFRKKGLSEETVAEFLALLRQISAVIPIQGTLRVCEDPDDDAVIETAILGSVMMVVTGDLLHLVRPMAIHAELHKWGIRIVTLANLVEVLDEMKKRNP